MTKRGSATARAADLAHRRGGPGHAAKELRRRLEWTQVAMAKFLEVEEGTVGRWERGETKMPPATRKLLERELATRRRSPQRRT